MMGKDLAEFENKQTPEQVLELMKNNEMWVNAFLTINPSDKFKLELADNILHMIEATKHREFGAKITYIRIATS